MKWAIGAVAAVLGAMALLPGVASAGHFEYEQEIVCDDGTFIATLSYDAGGTGVNVIIVVAVEDENFDGDSETGGVSTTLHSEVNVTDNTNNNDFNYSPTRERFEVDGHPGPADNTDHFEDFMTISGNYDDVNNASDDAINIEGSIWLAGGAGPGDDAHLDDEPVGGASTPQIDANQGESGLVFMRAVSLEDFEICDRIAVCMGDNTEAVFEFIVNNNDLDEGECGPPPPPDTPPTVTTPPVQQVAAAVSEVLPARLPSTGMGPGESDSNGFGLGLVALAVGLLSLGGIATVVVRRSGS